MAETETATATKHLTLRCQFCETWNRIDAARAADRPKCGKCGKPMLLDRPFPLNDETFARTIQEAEVPVLLVRREGLHRLGIHRDLHFVPEGRRHERDAHAWEGIHERRVRPAPEADVQQRDAPFPEAERRAGGRPVL